jgi:hypothetical protein
MLQELRVSNGQTCDELMFENRKELKEVFVTFDLFCRWFYL